MTHSFDINFEPRAVREAPGRASVLDVVFTPVDGFTGQIAPGVRAEIRNQVRKARRSLSGHLVFERLIAADKHLVEFDGLVIFSTSCSARMMWVLPNPNNTPESAKTIKLAGAAQIRMRK